MMIPFVRISGTPRPNATDEEIEAACREANCDGFIRKMEKGYDTPTGENGNLHLRRVSVSEFQSPALF